MTEKEENSQYCLKSTALIHCLKLLREKVLIKTIKEQVPFVKEVTIEHSTNTITIYLILDKLGIPKSIIEIRSISNFVDLKIKTKRRTLTHMFFYVDDGELCKIPSGSLNLEKEEVNKIVKIVRKLYTILSNFRSDKTTVFLIENLNKTQYSLDKETLFHLLKIEIISKFILYSSSFSIDLSEGANRIGIVCFNGNVSLILHNSKDAFQYSWDGKLLKPVENQEESFNKIPNISNKTKEKIYSILQHLRK